MIASVTDDVFRNPCGVKDYAIAARYWRCRRPDTPSSVSGFFLFRAGMRRDGHSSVIVPSFQWIFIVLFETKKREPS
ncbi:hypothetical protein [Acidomonas methanolica]|uniref:hypothetical protein n=1 Tax=Acidomonas methanolica TaxID=437 RepID=UPI001046969E|nr:hypothetical protein [Acidomonas methanolica]MBU2654030.1 hypothetical protein [Acidomonas methanolica]